MSGDQQKKTSIAKRQLTLAIVAALVIGFVYGGVQIAVDWHDQKQRIIHEVNLAVDGVRRSAGTALWELNDDLAVSILEGLGGQPFIAQARLMTSPGLELGRFPQRYEPDAKNGVADYLFFPVREQSFEIQHLDREQYFKVGNLIVSVDPQAAYDQFVKRAWITFFGGLLKSMILSAALYWLFTITATRPLNDLAHQIASTDPISDQDTLVSVPDKHRGDELGEIAGAFNRQVRNIRDAIRRLSQAESELAGANLQLEKRVLERTRELEHEIENKIAVERKLRIAMEETDRLADIRAQFLANMSHELRTPLNAIIGFSSLLMETNLGADETSRRQYIGHIHDAGEELLKLVNDLLDLSKIDSGQINIEREYFDVNEMVQEIGSFLAPLIERNHNTFEFEALPSGATIFSDQGRLRQVMTNFIANAAKFTHNGKIAVSIDRSADDASIDIQISDTGAGISPEFLPSIFEPYTQSDAAKAGPENGTGLGLMIVRSICDSMHWKIDVTSRLDEGTCFTLSLDTGNTAIQPPPIKQSISV